MPQAAAPTAADRALFGTGTGHTNQNCTIDVAAVCRDLIVDPAYTVTITGNTTRSVSIGDGSGGTLTLHAGFTWTAAGSFAMNFVSTATNGGVGWPITSAGQALSGTGNLNFTGAAGRWQLQDAISAGTGIFSSSNTNTIDFNGKTVTCVRFNPGNSTSCLFGAATINATSTANVTIIQLPTATCTGTPTLVIVNTATVARAVVLQGQSVLEVRYTVAGSTGQLNLNMGTGGSITTLSFSDATNARTLSFNTAATGTIVNWAVNGTAGKVMSVISNVSGTPAAVTFTTPQTCNYVSFKDFTAAGGRFLLTDGPNYTNVSGNTNVAFVDSFVSDTETGSGADTNSATTATFSSAETSTTADADSGSMAVSFTSPETSTSADTDAATSVTTSSAETATGADAEGSTGVTTGAGETATGTDAETAAITVSFSSADTMSDVESGGITFIKTSADIAAGTDTVVAVVVIDAPVPSLRHLVAATDALLAMTAGQRAESVQFIVLDGDLNVVGQVHPGRGGMTVTHDATRTLTRTLEGLYLRWDQIGDLDTLEHRIRPEWVLQNGVTFPLGVFVFAHDPRSRHALGADIHASLVDQSSLLEQSDGLPVSYPLGTNVGDAIAAEWRAAGFAHFTVDSTAAVIGGPLAWAPGATRGQRMRDLSALAGFLPPYFDNSGRGVSRAAPDLSIIAARFRYLRGTTIDRDSIVEDDDRLEASNRYVVVSTSGADAPIVGVYDLPSSVPWSAARRRAIISSVETLQGIENSAQAAAIAKANAMSDPSLFTRVDFDAAADPRHDSWDVLTYDGAGDELAYLETGWRLELRPGGRHHHSARRSLIDA